MALDHITTRPSAFLLARVGGPVARVVGELRAHPAVVWAAPAYGPYPVVAYAQADTPQQLAAAIEAIRAHAGLHELDARVCKPIPGDETLAPLHWSRPDRAMLLINVDYRVEKERVVTANLRRVRGIVLARAMWGPADIVALVEAADGETMRDLICDAIKTMPGVATNTTLYVYPS